MILSTHALAGAAFASLFPSRPITAFLAGFLSHFMLDAIPHWDYKIRSDSVNPSIGAKIILNRDFYADAFTITIDIIAGIALSAVIFGPEAFMSHIVWGAIGGIMPDPLQFLYARFKHEPLITLQKFHKKIQENNHIFRQSPIIGITLQIIFIAALIGLSKFIGSII